MKDDMLYLGDMLDLAMWIARRIRVTTREQFNHDEVLRIALAHQIQIIGEAASRVSKATREAHSEIPWSEIVGMRHKIVHDYFNISDDAVWNVATTKMESLIAALESFVPPVEGGE